ncbi:hypothetical protein Pst134EA_011069 [Puccinia striiformis f. sp. tritici]|nr:hypothetical protein Pst134EA_011069 [Puccinia striiformis f. sp. tritici]KAH9455820.1 hypothetical protein Pst134EB_012056 [Puccinia striiformis f. sp. tritici]KAH9467424.1 hypothetical protein Pst134EA_011069 [Puccinia striiformis f. sp. tritici]KAI9627392.1 hypothetical protein H4Q26_017389 [Puccinia striiformis f. sp. tritici PST-130]KNE94371.1 hypothetical protein PSTG_12271 [Puccinia striiformis f. sp. tritici PST-78]
MMGRSIHEVSRRSPHITNAVADDSTPAGRVAALSERKSYVENELHQQYDVLTANSIDLTSPLTDVNGFPRDDVPDLASVRVARARICELKNDHRSIVDQLAQALPLLLPKQGEDCPSPSKDVTTNGSSSSSMVPFAKVDMVTPGSPAEQAGLKLQDQIVRFGPLNSQNHDRLQALGKLVAESEGGTITVVCFRFEEGKKSMISRELKPYSGWGGRGLLGCHIIPL